MNFNSVVKLGEWNGDRADRDSNDDNKSMAC